MPSEQKMDAYDPGLAPVPFGLQNTGALCYFNSFLQILAGCTAFTRQVLTNEALMHCTRTGRAVLEFCRAYAEIGKDGHLVARTQPADNIQHLSSVVFEALLADGKSRGVNFELGRGQDDVRAVVDMFVDMLELTPEGANPYGGTVSNAVTQLFYHKYDLTTRCRACKREHHPPPEGKMAVFKFVPHSRRAYPTTPQEFSSWLRRDALWNEDYRCEGCSVKSRCVTEYNLAIVPEIILCMFSLRNDQWVHIHRDTGQRIIGNASGERRPYYFPERLEFPALGGGIIVFRLVGQAEHSGSNTGGHYWERGLRAGGQVYTLNDTGASPGMFGPSPGTYLIAYHYDGLIPANASSTNASSTNH